MCKEWLIYKYYSSCGRAQNGGPYHSHPTMCFEPCGRERKEYHSPQEVSLPPKERIAWRARSCRKCLDSIDDRRWWLEYGYGTGEVPKDPKNDDLFDAKGAPPRHQYAQASGSGARASRPRSSSWSTQTEIHREINQPRDDPDIKVPEGEFRLDWVNSSVLGKMYPESLRTGSWIEEQQRRVRGSRPHKSPHEPRTPASSTRSGSTGSSTQDSQSRRSGSSIPQIGPLFLLDHRLPGGDNSGASQVSTPRARSPASRFASSSVLSDRGRGLSPVRKSTGSRDDGTRAHHVRRPIGKFSTERALRIIGASGRL